MCELNSLINWVIKNNIPEPNFDEIANEGLKPHAHFLSYGGGFPRDKDDLINNICVLKLNSSNIEYLPKEIGCLTKLKTINLSDNNIQTLPDEICDLENLEILDISNNDILKLPTNIVQLKKLRVFIFAGNQNLKLTSTQEDWIKQFKKDGQYGY